MSLRFREQRRLCAPRAKSGAPAPGASAPRGSQGNRTPLAASPERRGASEDPEPGFLDRSHAGASAADPARRGAARRPSSLRGHSEGIEQGRSPAPGRGHTLPPEHPWGLADSFPVGVAAGITGQIRGKALQLARRSQVEARSAGCWRLLGLRFPPR